MRPTRTEGYEFMMTREDLSNLPKKSESFTVDARICIRGAAVEKGKISYWEDGSTELDIYGVDAYSLMQALNVDTLDDLFLVIRNNYWYNSLQEFLKVHEIGYAF